MELGKTLRAKDVAGDLVVIGMDRSFDNFAPVLEANERSIVWSKNMDLCYKTKANVVVAVQPTGDHDKTFIISPNPRYTYGKLVEHYAPKVYITGKYKVGGNARIHPTAIIYDNVEIGDNVVIYPYCVIGAEGFGFTWWKGKQHKFPHIGGVKIGDNVEIQAFTNVDRGGLGDTVIGSNTKIDTHCHIGHNTKIGSGCTICAKVQTGGSNIIGDMVFLAPNTVIRTGGITIGDGAFVGVGSLIVKDVKPGERVMGHPAKPF